MQENKILYSDASYDTLSKTASISVFDVISNETFNNIYHKIENITVAETMALRYSISIAINHNYDNVVFIYDNHGIDVNKLKEEYQSFFKVIQFVWLKREFLTKVDNNAKEALRSCFTTKKANKEPIEQEVEQIKKESNIIKSITDLRNSNAHDIIIYFYGNVLNKKEQTIIRAWENKVKDPTLIHTKSINFTKLRLLYMFIKEKEIKQELYKYLEYYYPRIKDVINFKELIQLNKIKEYIKLP